VRCLSPRELPGTFDRVEFRAVGRHKQPSKPLPVRVAPFFVQAGMMVPNIIHNQHHPAPGMARDPAKLFQKREECLGVETLFFTTAHELPIPDAHGVKITDPVPGGMMKHDRVLDLQRYPHPTGRTVLFESDLIDGPKIHHFIPGQDVKLFLCRWPDRIGMGYRRPGLSLPKAQLTKQALALPAPQ
jgi:hypothetical protein